MPREYLLEVMCLDNGTLKGCGAHVGEPCRNKNGKELPPSLSHKARQVEYERNQALQDAKKVVDHEDSVHRALLKDTREEKITKVLWAINFGRRCMHMTQDQLDRRMAEWVVDGDLDEFVR